MRVLAVFGVIFGLIGLVVLADVYEQWSNNGVSSPAAYGQSIKTRLGLGETHHAQAPKAFLPQALEGWTRRDWEFSDNERLPGLAGAEEEKAAYAQFGGFRGVAMQVNGFDQTILKMRSGTTFVYLNDTKYV